MRFDTLTALFAGSSVLLGVSAGPLAAKRQDGTTSASSSAPTAGLVVSTMSDGKETTVEVAPPQATSGSPASASGPATASEEASKTTAEISRTGAPAPPSTAFPTCHDTGAKPFCLPNNMSTLYTDKTYYATWNPDFFPLNSTVTVKVQFINDSLQEVWSSAETDNSMGYVTVPTNKDWLQGKESYNLTFYALNFEPNDATKQATPYDGPMITITNEPAQHYKPPEPTKPPNKQGLLIGLPVSLGFILIVVLGLFFGMRKHRTIGLGNIMGRRNRGYGAGKSRRQRLGLTKKKGAIRLDNREDSVSQFRDAPTRGRGDSLGSLADDDEIRPAPRGNQFRDEIRRQHSGR